MTVLDNYMFRPLLAIFRLSSRELKVLVYTYIYIYIYTVGAQNMYTHFKKGKDEYKSCLTSAITRGAQSGYHQRLDTSDYSEILLEQCSLTKLSITSLKMCIHFLAHPFYIVGSFKFS